MRCPVLNVSRLAVFFGLLFSRGVVYSLSLSLCRNITVMVDWALKTNSVSVSFYLSFSPPPPPPPSLSVCVCLSDCLSLSLFSLAVCVSAWREDTVLCRRTKARRQSRTNWMNLKRIWAPKRWQLCAVGFRNPLPSHPHHTRNPRGYVHALS